MVEVEVHTIGIDANWSQPLVLLRENGPGSRMLPIWVGEPEAAALVAARSGSRPSRPDTLTLIAAVLAALGGRLEGVVITELRGTVFHAALVIDGGRRIDARASDAIGLALRADVGIQVAETVFDVAAVPWSDVHESDGTSGASGAPGSAEGAPGSGEGAGAAGQAPDAPLSESEVERFRRLLEDASPSDFRPDRPPEPE